MYDLYIEISISNYLILYFDLKAYLSRLKVVQAELQDQLNACVGCQDRYYCDLSDDLESTLKILNKDIARTNSNFIRCKQMAAN